MFFMATTTMMCWKKHIIVAKFILFFRYIVSFLYLIFSILKFFIPFFSFEVIIPGKRYKSFIKYEKKFILFFQYNIFLYLFWCINSPNRLRLFFILIFKYKFFLFKKFIPKKRYKKYSITLHIFFILFFEYKLFKITFILQKYLLLLYPYF